MQNDTKEAAKESYLIDIRPLADMVDEALDIVGFRRVFWNSLKRIVLLEQH